MIKIQFNDEKIFRKCELSIVSGNVVQIIGDVCENISGFKTFTLGETELGDFTEYATIYRRVSGGIQFSNDGSVHTEHECATLPEVQSKIYALEKENKTLREEINSGLKEITDTQLALCEVYELMGV